MVFKKKLEEEFETKLYAVGLHLAIRKTFETLCQFEATIVPL